MESPSAIPEPIVIQYKRGPAPDRATIEQAKRGAMNPVSLLVPVDPHLTEPVVEQLVATLQAARFDAETTQRFLIGAGEAVANALRYGRPGSMASVLLVLFGEGPTRSCILSVQNELPPGMPLGLPDPKALPGFRRATVMETHGRGFRLMREFADDVRCLLHPDYSLATVLYFAPRRE